MSLRGFSSPLPPPQLANALGARLWAEEGHRTQGMPGLAGKASAKNGEVRLTMASVYFLQPGMLALQRWRSAGSGLILRSVWGELTSFFKLLIPCLLNGGNNSTYS